MAESSTERAKKCKAKKEAAGLTRHEFWLYAKEKLKIEELLKKWRAEK